MIDESLKSGIQLNSIRLLSSIFNRQTLADDPTDLSLAFQFDNKHAEGQIDVKVKVSIFSEEYPNFNVEVEMVGTFEEVGEISFPIEEFCGINAPAMIYPYIRQHVRILSLEAQMNPIVLPVVNFVSLYNKNKEEEE